MNFWKILITAMFFISKIKTNTNNYAFTKLIVKEDGDAQLFMHLVIGTLKFTRAEQDNSIFTSSVRSQDRKFNIFSKSAREIFVI